MNLKGGYKIISLMAITLIAGAVGGDRTPITDKGILEQLDTLKEFLDETKQLKPILLRVKDSGNEVVMANLSKKTGEDILYINADLVDASLNIMVKFAQDEDTQEIYIDEAGYLYIADVDKVASEVAKAEEGAIVDVLGLDEDGVLVKGNSFAEDMSGYTFGSKAVTNEEREIEYIYSGIVKNGNKLTIAIALNITKLGTITSSLTIGGFNLPSDVANKLLPTQIASGQYLSMLELKAFKSESESPVTLLGIVNKSTTTSIQCAIKVQGLNNFELNTKYYVRLEATFLLSDDLAD